MHFTSRSEARTLPAIFISQERLLVRETASNGGSGPEEDTADASSKGCFSNGVYVAPRAAGEIRAESSDIHHSDPQDVYYNLLRHRFLLLRSTLKCMPPPEAIAALDSQHPIIFPDDSKKTRSEWRWLLQTFDPQMVQIACMDPESVLRAITVVTRSISDAIKSGEVDRVKRLAAWAWGLLGRCREVGEMGSEEVADLRELGKRAVRILSKLREAEVQHHFSELQPDNGTEVESGRAPEEQVGLIECRHTETNDDDTMILPEASPKTGEENDGAFSDHSLTTNGVSEARNYELEAAKARLWARLASTFSDKDHTPGVEEGDLANRNVDKTTNCQENEEAAELRKQTRAMLDMIISVVGEFYGQRDLLEERDIWNEGDKGW